MLQRPTTFVIGAGASRDFGFPVGTALATEIADAFNINFEYQRLLTGSPSIYGAVIRSIDGLSDHEAFDLCHRIRRGLVHYDSIDDYVEAANDDQVAVAAKIAIFDIIGRAERNSSLAGLGTHESSKHVEDLRESWRNAHLGGSKLSAISVLLAPIRHCEDRFSMSFEKSTWASAQSAKVGLRGSVAEGE